MFNEVKRPARIPMKRRSATWRERHPELHKHGSKVALSVGKVAYGAVGALYINTPNRSSIAHGDNQIASKITRAAVWYGGPPLAHYGYKKLKKARANRGKKKR